MAEKTDEIEIEVDHPAQEVKKETEIAIPADEKQIVTPEQGIEELKAQLATERRAKEEAVSRARQAEVQATAAKSETDDTNLRLLTNAIITVRNNHAALEQSYATAMASSDYVAAAKVNSQIAKATLELSQLEAGEKNYRERIKTPPPRQITDPVEAFAAQLTPQSAAWVRAHPEYAKDPKLTRKMVRAHEDAMDDGIAPDSDDYFRAVESRLGLRQEAKQEIIVPDPMKEAAQVTQRRSSPPAAPVSRGTVNGSRPNTVRLSAQEREMAQMMGMTDQDYAKNKLALIKENKLSS